MSASHSISRRRLGALAVALAAAVVTACGGGGSGGAPTEQATAYAAGPISGFGSVIVNGVRFDDSEASVVDDDDGGHARDALKLGMMVEVDARAMNRGAGTGHALRIRFGSEIVGPVEAVDAAAGTLVVLGQGVDVKDTTVFDDDLEGGLAAVAPGDVLEIHARFDAATGRYTATRVDDEDDAERYKLRGLVSNLDPAAKTFTIGGALINYGGVAAGDLPNNLADGVRVRVRLLTQQVNGQWVATSVRHGVRKVEDRDDAHLRGTITALRSTTDFDVNGLAVNAAGASFPDGTEGIVLGAAVEVEGAVVEGVLVASKVELEERHGDRHRFELHGLVQALDTAARTFTLRGVTVDYSAVVEWEDGNEANLANGVRVEVKGVPSADRTRLKALKVEFEG
jgi:hypothetical protein